MLGGPARDGRGLVDVPSALGPVGCREPDEQRRVGRGIPDRVDDAQQQSRAVLERAAVLVVAEVRQRREELVQQVAVRGVDLEQLEARRRARADGGGGEVLRRSRRSPRASSSIGSAKPSKATADGATVCPAALVRRHRAAVARERRPGRGLASGVGELDAGERAARADRRDDRSPCRRAARRSRARCRRARCGPRARPPSPRRSRCPPRPTRTAPGACGATPAAHRRRRCTGTSARPTAGCARSVAELQRGEQDAHRSAPARVGWRHVGLVDGAGRRARPAEANRRR